jgi:succinyl-CoA synthetase beta subunit
LSLRAVRERDGKELLSRVGIAIPKGELVTSAEECAAVSARIGGPVMLKAQTFEGRRGKRGAVIRAMNSNAAAVEFSAIRKRFPGTSVLVEQAVAHTRELYIAIDTRGSSPRLIFSPHGGIDVDSQPYTRSVRVRDPVNGPREDDLAECMRDELESDFAALRDIVSRLWTCVRTFDALLVEINPVGVTDEGLVALDAKIVLDGFAADRHRDGFAVWPATLTGRESEVDLIELGGKVAVIGLGAGLSIYMADRLAALGPGCSYVFDFTRAAVTSWGALFARQVQPQLVDVIRSGFSVRPDATNAVLVNLTSGGTPVDSLLLNVLAALPVGYGHPVVVHVAGNSMSAARALLASLPYRSVDSIDEALRQVAALA